MTAGTPILEVEGLEVIYDAEVNSTTAVRDVSFVLDRGETLGLVGESGSGKTTIGLAIINHLAENGRVSHGAIRFDGTDLVRLRGSRLRKVRGQRIAMVYQDPLNALNPSMRIGTQIAEVFRQRAHASIREVKDRTVALLERVHLPDAGYAYRRYPHEFSGGQQQRIVIAMALAMNPDLLILDEPTTGLDVTVEAEILDLFAELRRSVNAGILFISHNVAVVAKMCDRVGILYSGQLVEIGSTSEILREPSHPYSRALLSARIPFGASKVNYAVSAYTDSGPVLLEANDRCSFVQFCSFAKERCRVEAPQLLANSKTRQSRCFFHQEVREAPRLASRPRPVLRALASEGALLQLQDISKSFRSSGRAFRAVAGVAITVERGRVLGIVGESGSGKTTTLRMIAGLLAPDQGSVIFEGEEITGPVQRRSRQTKRAIQMVFQNPDSTLNPEHRVRHILKRAARMLTDVRDGEADELVGRMMRAVRLDDGYLDAFPDELSGGQRQRVAIARAFIANPDLVLCDEPTSALDVSIQASILDLLVDLQYSRANSYIFISHDLAVVRFVSDEIAVMYLGEVIEFGPAEQVFTAPNHPYTETLLAAVLSLADIAAQRPMKLGGSVPSLLKRPRGCPFHPRCPRKVGAICETPPPWQEPSGKHQYRCVISPTERRSQQAEWNSSEKEVP